MNINPLQYISVPQFLLGVYQQVVEIEQDKKSGGVWTSEEKRKNCINGVLRLEASFLFPVPEPVKNPVVIGALIDAFVGLINAWGIFKKKKV